MPIRILLVDDHGVLRAGLRALPPARIEQAISKGLEGIAMALGLLLRSAGLTGHIWAVKELLTTVVLP